MGVGLIDDFTPVIFYPYNFVRTILSMSFVQYHFVRIPFSPYHFARTILSATILSKNRLARCRPYGFFLMHSTLASKLFFLVVQGSGAPLSSKLEAALYKSP